MQLGCHNLVAISIVSVRYGVFVRVSGSFGSVSHDGGRITGGRRWVVGVVIAGVVALGGMLGAATPAYASSPTITVGSDPYGVAFTPDGTKAYVADGGGTVSVIDVATGTVLGS